MEKNTNCGMVLVIVNACVVSYVPDLSFEPRSLVLEQMMIYIHALLGFAIVMIGSDFAAIDGRKARELALPCSGITPFIPWIALGAYVLIVILTRRNAKRYVRVVGVLAGYILAVFLVGYPNLIFKRSSERIDVRDFLPTATITAFQHHFDTPTVQFRDSSGGPWLVVPKSKYNASMRVWVRTQETKLAEQAESTVPMEAAPGASPSAR